MCPIVVLMYFFLQKNLHWTFQFRLIYNENKNKIIKYVIGGLMDTKHFHIIISNYGKKEMQVDAQKVMFCKSHCSCNYVLSKSIISGK